MESQLQSGVQEFSILAKILKNKKKEVTYRFYQFESEKFDHQFIFLIRPR